MKEKNKIVFSLAGILGFMDCVSMSEETLLWLKHHGNERCLMTTAHIPLPELQCENLQNKTEICDFVS